MIVGDRHSAGRAVALVASAEYPDQGSYHFTALQSATRPRAPARRSQPSAAPLGHGMEDRARDLSPRPKPVGGAIPGLIREQALESRNLAADGGKRRAAEMGRS